MRHASGENARSMRARLFTPGPAIQQPGISPLLKLHRTAEPCRFGKVTRSRFRRASLGPRTLPDLHLVLANRRPILVFRQAPDFQRLFAWSIRERHTKNRWRPGTDRDLAFTSVRGDRAWIPFIAKRSHPGQDGAEDRFRDWYLGRFSRLSPEGTNATSVRLPIELKIMLLAQAQQIIDQTDNTALSRLECRLKPLRE